MFGKLRQGGELDVVVNLMWWQTPHGGELDMNVSSPSNVGLTNLRDIPA